MHTSLIGRVSVRRGYRAAGILIATAMLSHGFIARSSIFTDPSSVLTASSSVEADGAAKTVSTRRGTPSRPDASTPSSSGREPVATADDSAPMLSGPGYSTAVLALEAVAILPCPCTVPPPLQP